MCLIPLPERSSIDLNHSGLCESIGTDELVVRRMVCDDDDSNLSGDPFRSPREIARLKTKSTELSIASTSTDEMDSLGTDTGVGFLTTGFESALLPCEFTQFSGRNICQRHMGFLLRTVICSLCARGGAFVSAITADTHDCGFWV